MFRTTIPLTLLALALGGVTQESRRPAAPKPERSRPAPAPAQEDAAELGLKEERMIIEYSAAAQEAVVLIEAESEEALASVSVLGPGDASVLELLGAGEGKSLALSGFVVESRELAPQDLFALYPEGAYDMRARSTGGRLLLGNAQLSHRLLAEPALLYPPDGATNVPPDLTVGWISDPLAIGYQVVLEQGENDGLVVKLPAGSSSLQVPPGVLAPGKASHVEVGAIEASGNLTLVESYFTTR
jgi:hypothetical protein